MRDGEKVFDAPPKLFFKPFNASIMLDSDGSEHDRRRRRGPRARCG